jgi:iron-sulfur cluster repair protein YtfE (RIC family)
MKNMSLAEREKLPDALRVLIKDYPRGGWATDPGFDGLVRFWLDRHLMFRRLIGEMGSATQAHLDRKITADRYASLLAKYGGMFVNGMHEHHTIEDTYYFPKLAIKDPRIKRGFDILDKDHHNLDSLLSDFVSGANGLIQGRDNVAKMYDGAGKFQKELHTLERLLDRHLVDEEELVVPVILRFGSAGLG